MFKLKGSAELRQEKIEEFSGDNDSYLLCGKSGLFLRNPHGL
jgi:hypothetical protein